MASYIGKVQIGTGTPALVGSTLYGICKSQATATAKTVIGGTNGDDNSGKFINNNYDQLLQGTTIHIKFVNGNTATTGLTLQVGTVATPHNIVGNCTCPAGTIISFTLDENEYWVVNDNVDTNTEYVFDGTYNASTNKVLLQSSVSDAAHKGVDTSITSGNLNSTDLPTTAAVTAYVQEQTGGLAGLTGAMHFRGQLTSNEWPMSEADAYANYISGDVVLVPGDKEYVYVKGNSAATSEWVELGDEGSYVLQTSITTGSASQIQNNGWTTNTLPSLTLDNAAIGSSQKLVTAVTVTNSNTDAASLTTDTYTIPNVTIAGTAMTAEVSSGILTLTPGTDTTLGTAFTVKSVNQLTAQKMPSINVSDATVGWDAGTAASLNYNNITVVVPVTNP